MDLDAREVEGLKEAIAAVDDVARRHVPFAVSVAINRTLEEFLAVARGQIQERLTVRVPRFTLPPVQLPTAARATKAKLFGQAALGYGDVTRDTIGERREKLLRKFESGGTKTARDPQFPIAIPTQAIRPSFGALVPRTLYPQNLRLAPKVVGSGETLPALRKGKVRSLDGGNLGKRARKQQGLEGVGGTFTINDENGRPIGVFQRVGRGNTRNDVRMIWAYKQRIQIPDRMDFFDLADLVVRRRLVINFDGALAQALATAR